MLQGEAFNRYYCGAAGQLRIDKTVMSKKGTDNKVESGRMERMKALSSIRKGTIPVRAES